MYRLNRIPDTSYRKFLKLLGIPRLQRAQPAKVALTFSPISNQVDIIIIPAGTQVATTEPVSRKDIIFETETTIAGGAKSTTVSALQQRTFKDKFKDKFSADGLPDFSVVLNDPPIITITKLEVREDANTWHLWEEFEDFDASKPIDRHYTLNAATGRATFGNGLHGKIPPKGDANITVSYCAGGGVRGNVGPKTIIKVIGNLAGKVTVTNEHAASGGKDAETLTEGKYCARQDLKTITRAVTSQDYEALVLDLKTENNTPLVGRVKAIPRYHPVHGIDNQVPGIVTVVVIPNKPEDSQLMPAEDDLREVYKHLDQYRLLITELFVIPPEYVGVSIKATVVVKPQYLPRNVEDSVKKALKKILDPLDVEGRKGWSFGHAVYRSEIFEIIDQVPGVDYVNAESLVLYAYPFKYWLNIKGNFQNGDIPNTLKKALQEKDPSFPPNYICAKDAAHIMMLIDPEKKVYYRIIEDNKTLHNL